MTGITLMPCGHEWPYDRPCLYGDLCDTICQECEEALPKGNSFEHCFPSLDHKKGKAMAGLPYHSLNEEDKKFIEKYNHLLDIHNRTSMVDELPF